MYTISQLAVDTLFRLRPNGIRYFFNGSSYENGILFFYYVDYKTQRKEYRTSNNNAIVYP